ncbi:MAG: hypothetical protein E7I59_16910 [Phytobacter diazotrophicus]|nr:hypothetical protein [Phytobacter diazotrophicus]
MHWLHSHIRIGEQSVHPLGQFSQKDANEWIEYYQEFFVDKTPDDSENRLWMLRNMGRVL